VRECGECTACCEGWLPDESLDMYAGKACAHCQSEGCAIYETRPEEPCRTFKCAWLQDEVAFPAEMRPDQCGAIVLSARYWKEWNVMRAMPVGPIIPEERLNGSDYTLKVEMCRSSSTRGGWWTVSTPTLIGRGPMARPSLLRRSRRRFCAWVIQKRPSSQPMMS